MRDPEKLFADAIIGWHEACGRHDLPWQVEDWYPRLVSEVMLQQTQVVSVLPKYEAFMTAFPTPECLAAAPDDDVMALWAGLGYYSRARNLLKAVRIIVNEMGGRCPETAAELEKLPGLGPRRRAPWPLSPSARGPSWRTGTHSACSRACSWSRATPHSPAS